MRVQLGVRPGPPLVLASSRSSVPASEQGQVHLKLAADSGFGLMLCGPCPSLCPRPAARAPSQDRARATSSMSPSQHATAAIMMIRPVTGSLSLARRAAAAQALYLGPPAARPGPREPGQEAAGLTVPDSVSKKSTGSQSNLQNQVSTKPSLLYTMLLLATLAQFTSCVRVLEGGNPRCYPTFSNVI